ncbi:MAG: M16 family metallopeptidase [Candidatus Bipolaricaulia bacterium]
METIYQNCYRETLVNGMDLLLEQMPYAHSVSLGVWLRTGSRDEPKRRNGITHFIEHMLFKGTHKRTAFQISEEIDAIGGIINAVTAREYVCYYVDCLPHHLGVALDVLSDLVQNPRFLSAEIEREKGVVLEEIRMGKEDPKDEIFDLFAGHLWQNGHPLSIPVVGDEQMVKELTREELVHQFHRHYHPGNMVLAAAGNLDERRFLELAEARFGDLRRRGQADNEVDRTPPQSNGGFHLVGRRNAQQTHICLGTKGIRHGDERRFALGIMNTVLGGGMSSRLFKRIREETGLAYAVFSTIHHYSDTGLFLIYAGTDPDNVKQVIEISLEEIDRLKEQTISPETLRLAKEKIKGNLLLGLESSHARMTRLGIAEVYEERPLEIDEWIVKIDEVDREAVHQVSEELFGSNHLTLTVITPRGKSHSDLSDLLADRT